MGYLFTAKSGSILHVEDTGASGSVEQNGAEYSGSPVLALHGIGGGAYFFAGVAKTPLSSLIMVSEMTTGYGLLAPLMLTTGVCYLLTPRKISMYEHQVNRRTDSPAHEGEFVVDILERLRVREAIAKDIKLTVFRRNTPLAEMLEGFATSKQHIFPVLEDGELLHGIIYFDDIRVFFTERGLRHRWFPFR